MNLPFFIARRVAFSGDKRFSGIIIRIAITAVSLSVAVMISATCLIAGFKAEISRKIFEFWGHLHVSDTSYSLSFDPQPIDLNQSFYPSLENLQPVEYEEESSILGFSTGRFETVHARGGVRHIQAFAHKPGIIRTKTDIEGIILKGIGRDFDWENIKPYLQEGEPFNFDDTTSARKMIVSRQTADRLLLKMGDKFILHFVKDGEQVRRRFEVGGIYRTGLEEYDRKFALCDIREVQALLGWRSDQVAGFEIWLDDLRDLDLYNEYLYGEVLPNELLCVSIRDKFPAIFEWLRLQNYNEAVILALMLAVAIINMATALLVLVLERTSMIGILKALGAGNRVVRRIFLYHAGWIMLMGIFWGNVLGLGFCLLEDRFRFIRLNETDYYLSYAPVRFEWGSIMAINIGTLALTLVFLLIPTLIISKIAPVRAIRFK